MVDRRNRYVQKREKRLNKTRTVVKRTRRFGRRIVVKTK